MPIEENIVVANRKQWGDTTENKSQLRIVKPIDNLPYALLAQRSEHPAHNRQVQSSILRERTICPCSRIGTGVALRMRILGVRILSRVPYAHQQRTLLWSL